MASFNFQAALASGATPQAITSYLSSQGQGQLAQTYFNTNPPNPNTGNNPAINALAALKNYAGSVFSSMKSSGQSAVSDLEDAAPDNVSDSKKIQGGFQAVGDLASGIMSPLTEGIKGIANGLAGTKAVQAVANSGAGNAIAGAENAASNNPVIAKLSAWAQQHPDAAKDLGALGNITALGTSIDAAPSAVDLAEQGAGKVGEAAAAVGDKVTSALPEVKPSDISPKNPLEIAQEARSIPPTPKETMQADLEGRTSMVNGKKIISTPSDEEAAMDKALQPLAEKSQLTANKDIKTGLIKPGDQANNIANVSDELQRQTANIRAQAQTADSATGKVFDEGHATDLKDKIDGLERPTTIKSDTALQSRLDDFDDAVKNLIDKEVSRANEASGNVGSGRIEGGLNLRQGVRQLLDDELPKAWEPKTRADTALEAHAKDVYNTINDSIKGDLPNGKLPDGTDWTEAGRTQSGLIDAQSELARKYASEYKVGEGEWARIMKAHPALRMAARIIGRQVLRIPITLGEEGAGITALERSITKAK